jgi:hypothetical protein
LNFKSGKKCAQMTIKAKLSRKRKMSLVKSRKASVQILEEALG